MSTTLVAEKKTDVKIDELVELTENYVGADIESVCREAAMLSLRKDIETKEVTIEFFQEALKKVRPSVNKEIEDAMRKKLNIQNYVFCQ